MAQAGVCETEESKAKSLASAVWTGVANRREQHCRVSLEQGGKAFPSTEFLGEFSK